MTRDSWAEDPTLADLPKLVEPPELRAQPTGALVRIGIVNDGIAYGGHTPEEERTEIIGDLRAHWAGFINAELVWGSERPSFADMPEVDVLIVDYGALWQHDDIVEDYSRRLREWADEHPGRLVVLWTSFTSSIYRRVFRDELDAEGPDGAAANVLARYGSGRWGDTGMDGEDREDFWRRLRRWVGYPAEIGPVAS